MGKRYLDYLTPLIQDFVRDVESLPHPDYQRDERVEELEAVVCVNPQRTTRLRQSTLQKGFTEKL